MEFYKHPIQTPADVQKMEVLDPNEPGIDNDFEQAFSLYRDQGYFTVAGLAHISHE